MKKNTKGFTLAELLIVVAIIAVLVAISIPVFTSQLHKARVATDWANVRAYYAELQYDFMETGKIDENKLREPGPNPPITSFIIVTNPAPLLFLLNPFCNYVHTHS